MIRKIALLILTALVFSSCNDINYDGETRLVLQGRLVDENGAPLANRFVDIAVYNDLGYGSHATEVISNGTTDANGNFKYVIPAPKNYNHYMSIRINSLNNNYQYKEFALIQRKDFSGYRFDAGTVTLYPTRSISKLIVTTHRIDPAHELTNLSIDGLRADETIFVNSLQIDYEYFENYFDVIKNQIVTLHYTIMDHSNPNNPEWTEHETPIVIGNESQVNYNLNY